MFISKGLFRLLPFLGESSRMSLFSSSLSLMPILNWLYFSSTKLGSRLSHESTLYLNFKQINVNIFSNNHPRIKLMLPYRYVIEKISYYLRTGFALIFKRLSTTKNKNANLIKTVISNKCS